MRLEHVNVPCVPTYNHLGQAINLADHRPDPRYIKYTTTIQYEEVMDAQKVRDVIKSCQNLEHLEVAKNLTDNFLGKWGPTHSWSSLFQLVQEKYETLELEIMED